MELRAYLNLLSQEEQAAFAEGVGTSIGYLRKAISVGQEFGSDLALAIERESGGRVTIDDLRPSFAAALKKSGYIKTLPEQKAAL